VVFGWMLSEKSMQGQATQDCRMWVGETVSVSGLWALGSGLCAHARCWWFDREREGGGDGSMISCFLARYINDINDRIIRIIIDVTAKQPAANTELH
jgi:hypothetical protein